MAVIAPLKKVFTQKLIRVDFIFCTPTSLRSFFSWYLAHENICNCCICKSKFLFYYKLFRSWVGSRQSFADIRNEPSPHLVYMNRTWMITMSTEPQLLPWSTMKRFIWLCDRSFKAVGKLSRRKLNCHDSGEVWIHEHLEALAFLVDLACPSF
jgi:hypothetical protein